MRFLGDMGISPRVIERLRERGHDAVHLHEIGLGRLTDDRVLDKAREERRVLLTHDLDFGYLLSLSGESCPSVVLFRLTNMSANSVFAALSGLLPALPAETDFFAVVADSDSRIRELPLHSAEDGDAAE